jgi:hypothetical protein
MVLSIRLGIGFYGNIWSKTLLYIIHINVL